MVSEVWHCATLFWLKKYRRPNTRSWECIHPELCLILFHFEASEWAGKWFPEPKVEGTKCNFFVKTYFWRKHRFFLMKNWFDRWSMDNFGTPDPIFASKWGEVALRSWKLKSFEKLVEMSWKLVRSVQNFMGNSNPRSVLNFFRKVLSDFDKCPTAKS